MEDILPEIRIKADVDKYTFVKCLAKLAESSGVFVKINNNTQNSVVSDGGKNKWERVDLHLTPYENSDYTCGQILTSLKNDNYVSVRVIKHHLKTEPVTYEEFVGSTVALFRPILVAYNRKYNSNRRFRIPSKESLESKLPPLCRQIFDMFISNANTSNLHPLDWERFYKFIRFCHTRNVKLNGEELTRLLIKSGFSEDYANRISIVYDHGRKLLKTYVATSKYEYEP